MNAIRLVRRIALGTAAVSLCPIAIVGCAEEETQAVVDLHLGSVSGTVTYLHAEGDERPADGATVKLALREGEDDSLCDIESVVCEAEVETYPDGSFEFTSVAPGYYKLWMDSQYYKATEDCSAKFIGGTEWVEMGEDADEHQDFLMGTKTWLLTQSLDIGGTWPGLEFEFSVQMCDGDGCEHIDFTETQDAEQCASWTGPDAQPDTEMPNTLEYRMTTSEFHVLDPDCAGGCCDGDDFEDYGDFGSYVRLEVDGETIPTVDLWGSSEFLTVRFDHEVVETPMDPFITEYVLDVEWLREFDVVASCD